MLKAVTVTNFKGESLRMELAKPEETGIIIRDITGLGSPKTTINSTQMATVDGSRFNSARAENRNIVLTLGFMEQTNSSGGSDQSPGWDGGGGSLGGSDTTEIKQELSELTIRIARLETLMPEPMTAEDLSSIINDGGENDE